MLGGGGLAGGAGGSFGGGGLSGGFGGGGFGSTTNAFGGIGTGQGGALGGGFGPASTAAGTTSTAGAFGAAAPATGLSGSFAPSGGFGSAGGASGLGSGFGNAGSTTGLGGGFGNAGVLGGATGIGGGLAGGMGAGAATPGSSLGSFGTAATTAASTGASLLGGGGFSSSLLQPSSTAAATAAATTAAAPSSSSFGAPLGSMTPGFPATKPAATPGFGATPAPTPGFGIAATPGFGGAATPGFGGAATPGFGGAATPGFGAATPRAAAAPTPGAFGTAAAGGATPTPARNAGGSTSRGGDFTPYGLNSTLRKSEDFAARARFASDNADISRAVALAERDVQGLSDHFSGQKREDDALRAEEVERMERMSVEEFLNAAYDSMTAKVMEFKQRENHYLFEAGMEFAAKTEWEHLKMAVLEDARARLVPRPSLEEYTGLVHTTASDVDRDAARIQAAAVRDVVYYDWLTTLNARRKEKKVFALCNHAVKDLKVIESAAQNSQRVPSRILSAWNLLAALVNESRDNDTESAPLQGAFRSGNQLVYGDRIFTPFATKAEVACSSTLVYRAKRFLEEKFCAELNRGNRLMGTNMNGGLVNVANSLAATHMLGGYKSSTNTYPYASIYYHVRMGKRCEALNLLKELSSDFERKSDREFVDIMTRYLEGAQSGDYPWPPQLWKDKTAFAHARAAAGANNKDRLELAVANDPYRSILIKMATRMEVDKRSHRVAQNLDDFIWLNLSMVFETEGGAGDSELSDLHSFLLAVDPSKLDADGVESGTEGLNYFFALLCTSKFEQAITHLHSIPSYTTDAVHFAIALAYYGLLNVRPALEKPYPLLTYEEVGTPGSGPSSASAPKRQLARVHYAQLVLAHARQLKEPERRLYYIMSLTLVQIPDFAEVARRHVAELVRQTKDVSLFYIKTNGRMLEGPAAVFRSLLGLDQDDDLRKLLAEAAHLCEDSDSLQIAAHCYFAAQRYDDCLRVLSQAVSRLLVSRTNFKELHAVSLLLRDALSQIRETELAHLESATVVYNCANLVILRNDKRALDALNILQDGLRDYLPEAPDELNRSFAHLCHLSDAAQTAVGVALEAVMLPLREYAMLNHGGVGEAVLRRIQTLVAYAKMARLRFGEAVLRAVTEGSDGMERSMAWQLQVGVVSRELDGTDRVLLPQNILDELVRRFPDSALPHPLVFQVETNKVRTHAGVREFTADDDTVGLPESLREAISAELGSMVTVRFAPELKKAKFLQLRLVSKGTRAVADLRAFLESQLRNRRTTMTQGETVRFADSSTVLIEKVEPAPAAIVVDTDVTVEWIGMQEPPSLDASVPAAIGAPLKVGAGAVTIQNLPGSEVVVRKVLPPDWKGAGKVEVAVEMLEGDADVFISRSEESPDAVNCDEFLVANPRGPKKLLVPFDPPFQIALRSWPQSSRWTASVSIAARLDQDAASPSSASAAAPAVAVEDGRIECSNCGARIPPASSATHLAFCQRNIQRCSLPMPLSGRTGCGVALRRNEIESHWHCQQCDEIGLKDDEAKHLHYFHNHVPCPMCKAEVASLVLLTTHVRFECPERKMTCKYCHDDIRAAEIVEHENACGGRTYDCKQCNGRVRLRDATSHAMLHEFERRDRPWRPWVACANARLDRGRMSPNAGAGGCLEKRVEPPNTLRACRACFAPFWTPIQSDDKQRLLQKLVMRYHLQMTKGCGRKGCGNTWCASRIGYDPMDATTAALKAVELARQFSENAGELFLCVDSTMARRRRLALRVAGQTLFRYGLEWCSEAVVSVERSKMDVDGEDEDEDHDDVEGGHAEYEEMRDSGMESEEKDARLVERALAWLEKHAGYLKS